MLKVLSVRSFRRVPVRDLLLVAAILFLAANQAVPRLAALAQEDGSAVTAAALGSSFTYQGRLTLENADASGPFDFQFALFDAPTSGNAIANTITADNLAVTNGLFTVQLAFSGTPFTGDARWLEVRVKADGAANFDVLPRQELTATPYALYAKNIPLAGTGTATTAARSDHDHFGANWAGSVGDGLTVSDTALGGTGIKGVSENGSGVAGYSSEPDYAAVYGSNDNGYGTVGDSKGSSLSGVLGRDPNGFGVWGQGSTGVKGEGLNGVLGYSNTRGFAGVYGVAATTDCVSATPSSLCYGVIGAADQTVGGGVGVMGIGSSIGVWGRSNGGVSSYAGSFSGPVYISGLVSGPSAIVTTQSIAPDGQFTRNLGFSNAAWNFVVADNFTNLSDVRLKHDIAPLTYGLDAVLALRPVSFKYNEGEQATTLGLIAQEAREVVPEVVFEGDDAEHLLTLDYTKLIPVLIKAIQEQQTQIDALESAVNADGHAVPASFTTSSASAAVAPNVDAAPRVAALAQSSAGVNAWMLLALFGLSVAVFLVLRMGRGRWQR